MTTKTKTRPAAPASLEQAVAARTTALELKLPDPLPEDVRELFEKCLAKLGLIPNVLLAYAHRPEKLRAFSLMYNDLMLGESGLTKLEREMIAVAVSSQNRCWYCQVAHGAAVRVLSGDPALGDALVMNWRVAPLTERQRAMIGFAEKMTVASSGIGEADRQALRDSGFSDEDIWDIAAVAGFFAMSNRMASAVEMVPNADYHAMAR
ncbi:MAG TPA: peroxidase-related enzyme [Paracoccaceae bacterium]|nr:peroxidase-related enzyme [Paracoccaceae bacterium]